MGLVTKPSDYTSATTATHTTLNTLKNTIYDEFNGNVDNDNVKSGAAITSSKIADTAAVLGNTVSPGEQTMTRPTKVSGRVQFKEADLSGWSFDEDDTESITINGATTFALVAGKGCYKVSITGAETLTTITGGQEGDVIYIVWMATDNTLTVTHTAATTTNTLSLRGRANETWTVAGGVFITRFRFSAIDGGSGKWFEC